MLLNQFDQQKSMELPRFNAEASLSATRHRYIFDTFFDERITIMPQDAFCKGMCVGVGKRCRARCGGNQDCLVNCSNETWDCIVNVCGGTGTDPGF
jgi:hypothetical protein